MDCLGGFSSGVCCHTSTPPDGSSLGRTAAIVLAHDFTVETLGRLATWS